MTDITVAHRVRAVGLFAKVVPFDTARDVESVIYHSLHTKQTEYNNKVLQLSWNLNFVPHLLTQHSLHSLPMLSDMVLARGTEVEQWWQEHDAKLAQQRRMLTEEAKFEEGEQINFGSLICNRCHSRSISVQQQQIRSADEGMTVFCTCNKCNLRWRM